MRDAKNFEIMSYAIECIGGLGNFKVAYFWCFSWRPPVHFGLPSLLLTPVVASSVVMQKCTKWDETFHNHNWSDHSGYLLGKHIS